nr:uncharacterized protein LOC123772730 [Procambarus clarkii]
MVPLVVGAVLENASLHHCSIILVTDGLPSYTTLYQAEWVTVPAGVGVMVVTSPAQDDLTSLTKALSHARELRVLARCVVVVVASDDPAFLVAFAQSSDRGRLLVWSTRLLVVTRAPLHEVMRLLRQYWTFSMMNTMFLTPGVPASGHRWDTYTHLPYSQLGPQVVHVATWTPARGLVLLSQHHLFPQKFKK